jgi:Rps23 Pro-64 3,4-dihydroxylase Tpa1-like proline 4-hydroxylase
MLSKPTIFAERIFYYESVIDNPYDVVDDIESLDEELSDKSLVTNWHTWSSSDGSYVFGKRKSTNYESFSEASDNVKKLYLLIDNLLSEYGEDYANKLKVNLGEKKAISISKYFTGSSMGKHTDSSPNPTIENISAVLYLNDDYSGGEIAFPDQGVVIKPTAGSLVIFPSIPPFFHESREITSGTKYMSPAFWHLTL